MKYGSVCSGIEAATAAWHPLGWQPVFFSEIDAFPSAVLARHYPSVPNFGDFTTIQPDRHDPIELLVGGTPCQSFSVAGLRGGLADDRGNLALEFLRLAQRARPRWLVWENVPGVLSSNGGRDFGAIVGGMVELGYGVAWRVLDAQFVRVDGYPGAVPQRRRRVFVVGYFGDWRRAAAVLFERASLLGDSPPSRKAGKGITGGASDGPIPGVANTIGGASQSGGFRTTDLDNQGAFIPIAFGGNDSRGPIEVAPARNAHGGPHGRLDFATEAFVTHAIQDRARCENPNAGPDGIGIRSDGAAFTLEAREPQAVAFKPSHYTGDKDGAPDDVFPPLSADADKGDQDAILLIPPQDAFNITPSNSNRDYSAREAGHAQAVTGNSRCTPSARGGTVVASGWTVRRLTPRECERLQGFPDDYTLIPWRGGLAADSPRYKALGNSMAVNVMRWIGQRIQMVEDLKL